MNHIIKKIIFYTNNKLPVYASPSGDRQINIPSYIFVQFNSIGFKIN